MLRLLILSIFLVAVKSDVDFFLGESVPVVTYPDRGEYSKECPKFNILKDVSKKCTCGGKGDSPVVKLSAADEPNPKGVPALIIGEKEDVVTNLKISCTCGGKSESPLVFEKINENYFMMHAGSSEDPSVFVSNVFVKKMPKLSELQDVLKGIPEVQGKAPGFLCKDSDFPK